MRWAWIGMLGAMACSGDDPEEGPLAVDLVELTTSGDGFTVNVGWDASGGDDMLLGIDIDYTVVVRLYDGATEVTDRVAAEPERYQVFFTGEGIEGPASAADPVRVVHTYDDDQLGLANLFDPAELGNAELVLTLQDLGDAKDPGLADAVKSEGLSALPGDTVVTATYPVIVL